MNILVFYARKVSRLLILLVELLPILNMSMLILINSFPVGVGYTY